MVSCRHGRLGAQDNIHDRACGGLTPAGRHHLGDHHRPGRHYADRPAGVELPARRPLVRNRRRRHRALARRLLALSDATAGSAVSPARSAGTAQIVAFAAVGAPFSYIAASLDLPLRDSWFDAADRALGLDWTSLLNWMDAHASLHPLFSIIYLSLLPQTVIVVLALALAGRLAWMRVFVLAFMISAHRHHRDRCAGSGAGRLGLLQTLARRLSRHRAGDTGIPFADLPRIARRFVPATDGDGLARHRDISQPARGARSRSSRSGMLANPACSAGSELAINTLMLVSIPVDGGHYFIDVPAGLAIAVLAIMCRCPPHCSVCPSAAHTVRGRPNRPRSRATRLSGLSDGRLLRQKAPADRPAYSGSTP